MHKIMRVFLKGRAASGNEWEGGSFFLWRITRTVASIERGAGSSFHIKVKMCDTLRGSHFCDFFWRVYVGFEDTRVLALQASGQ